jgi:hypothetical protein
MSLFSFAVDVSVAGRGRGRLELELLVRGLARPAEQQERQGRSDPREDRGGEERGLEALVQRGEGARVRVGGEVVVRP